MFVRKNKEVREFVDFCLQKFGDNLAAIVIHGSYALGFFDKNKSDYDTSIFFKKKVPKGRKIIEKKFPKFPLHYYFTLNELYDYCHSGHFTLYVTLLTKGSKVVYKTKEYKECLRKLKKKNLFDEAFDIAGLEAKSNLDIKNLQSLKGYSALKWAVPIIRKRLQFLTYIRKKKLIWSFNKNLRINKKDFTKDEINFMKSLNHKLYERAGDFGKKDKKRVLELYNKLMKDIIFKELNNLIS